MAPEVFNGRRLSSLHHPFYVPKSAGSRLELRQESPIVEK